jgi:hypothetical protein
MVLVGALLAVIFVVIEMSDRPTVRGVWVIEAMIEPALLILTGILVTGRAKLGLWLKYLLTADFVYSLILQFVRALRTEGLDDIYRVLFDACVGYASLLTCTVGAKCLRVFGAASKRIKFRAWTRGITLSDRTIHGDGDNDGAALSELH